MNSICSVGVAYDVNLGHVRTRSSFGGESKIRRQSVKWKLYDTIGVKPFWRHIIWVQLLFWSELYSHYWRILCPSVWLSDLKNSDDSWFTEKIQTGKVEIWRTLMLHYPPIYLHWDFRKFWHSPDWNIQFDELIFFPSLKTNWIFLPVQTGFFSKFLG